MKLAKPHVDVGLYTVERDAMLAFWQERIGLPFEETLPAGRGVHQLRLGMNGSVMKINHSRDPLAGGAARAATAELADRAPRTRRAGRRSSDPGREPDRHARAARAVDGVVGVGVDLWPCANGCGLRTASTARVSGLERRGRRNAYRCGDSLLRVAEADDVCGRCSPLRARRLPLPDGPGPRRRRAEHTPRSSRPAGARCMAPTTLGKVARISFVLDPGRELDRDLAARVAGPARSPRPRLRGTCRSAELERITCSD